MIVPKGLALKEKILVLNLQLARIRRKPRTAEMNMKTGTKTQAVAVKTMTAKTIAISVKKKVAKKDTVTMEDKEEIIPLIRKMK